MRRPGYLRNLADSWVDIQNEKALAARDAKILEDQSAAFIDTRSGSAITGNMRGIRSMGPVRLSSPDFLMQNAAWYREYMNKVMA